MSAYCFINGNFVQSENAVLHIRDLAIQRGYGVFDFFRVVKGQPLYLDDHLARFFASASEMHLDLQTGREEMKHIIKTLLQKNKASDCGIRITLTGGYSRDGYSISEPNLIISQHSFQLPDEAQYRQGIRLITHEHQRQLPHVKTIDYLMAIWLQPLLKKSGADDVLYRHNGWLSECPRANFFLVTGENKLVTPSEGVLKGITRKHILSLAAGLCQVEERDVSMDEIRTAREAFISSSTKKILPVCQIDAHVFLAHRPLTDQLFTLLNSMETEFSKQPAKELTQTVKEIPHQS